MNEPVLSAQNLSMHYPIKSGLFSKLSTLRALSNASFTLEAGKTLAVVGESGCGKSTLARVITMIEPPTEGAFWVNGIAAVQENLETLRTSVQIVFQDPYGSLNPRQRVGASLEEPLKINCPDLSASERTDQARRMLRQVGLRDEHFDRYPHMFSGGQRQRIAVARALMLNPKVLVLDEPVSALDLSIQSQILNLLVDLQDELNLAYLFISHDLSVVRHMADNIIVMYLGRPVELGPKAKVFAAPRHPYTMALMSATPSANPKARKDRIKLEGELPSPLNLPRGCAFAPRCWKVQDRCRSDRPELQGDVHQAACFFLEG